MNSHDVIVSAADCFDLMADERPETKSARILRNHSQALRELLTRPVLDPCEAGVSDSHE